MKELINFKGLNCYNNSIITIANERDIDYNQCFHNLWSEIDFDCHNPLEIYTSKRLFQNLSMLGIEIHKITDSTKLPTFEKNELFIVSMDSYFIPWNDIYQVRHDWHYFIVQNVIGNYFLCFDPTYHLSDIQISKSTVLNHANEICKINDVKYVFTLDVNLQEELNNVLSNNKKLESIISEKMQYANKNDIRLHHQTAKYIDAFINNRYMFKQYLNTLHLPIDIHVIMPENYFLTWIAVKNGLNKLSLSMNEGLCSQINHLIKTLLQKETVYVNQLKAYNR